MNPVGDQCPICGEKPFRTVFQASDRLYATTDRTFSVVECSSCGLLRLCPQPSEAELREYYPPSYWCGADGNTAAYLEELYRRWVLSDHVRFVDTAMQDAPRGAILDIGCGGALFGRLLKTRGYKCFGLDFSHQAAKVGWALNNVPVTVGDFTTAPFKTGEFAGITMFHVLEHLRNPAAALTSIRKLLCQGGRLIVQVPNASSWQFRIFGHRWNGVDVPRHLVNFRSRDIQKLLESCGFKILKTKHFSLRDNPAGLATTVAPGLDPMARRIRKQNETGLERLTKNMLYFTLVAGSLPFTLLEAACAAGSTVMIEARKVDA